MNGVKKITDQDELDAQLMADWEDIGGVGIGITKEQLEHISTTMFGCPPVDDEDE